MNRPFILVCARFLDRLCLRWIGRRGRDKLALTSGFRRSRLGDFGNVIDDRRRLLG